MKHLMYSIHFSIIKIIHYYLVLVICYTSDYIVNSVFRRRDE